MLPISLVAPGQTLNVTAVSLADKFQIGFLALPEAVKDVQKLATYTVEAFAQLRQATSTADSQPSKAAAPAAGRARKPAAKAAKKPASASGSGAPKKRAPSKALARP